MNFLDTYGITGSSDVTDTPHQPEQSLDEEVSQVIGQLGRFWGGFKKQSQAALLTAQKDLTGVVSQAQKELTKLTTDTEGTPRDSPSDASVPAPSEPETPLPSPSLQDANQPSTSTSSLFSRIIPPNLLESARNQLPESIKHASQNIDLPQLGTSLLSEIQRVQGVTRAQAEQYAHKSEALIRGAVKEAGEVLRDAVKIVPPDHQSEGSSSSVVWDGGNIWSLPLEPVLSDTGRLESPKQGATRGSDAQNAVATRVQSLLLRLKQDPEIIRRDPAVESLDASYAAWVTTQYEAKEGDSEGDKWSGRISALLDEAGPGDLLRSTRDTLVPSEMTESEFWKRFFFRVHQIEVEEEKRKALIEGTLEEEDFSWEDDDDETSAGGRELQAAQNSLAATHQSLGVPPTAHESSEEGYDVVSPRPNSPRGPEGDVEVAKPDTSDESDWE